MLDIKCADRSYIAETADYIVEGTLQKAEPKWNEQRTFISTYIDFSIEKYVKGASLAINFCYKSAKLEKTSQALNKETI